MKDLLTIGEIVSAQARIAPDRIGTRDLARSMTFRQWSERSCRLANGLLGLGLARGDRVAVLAYNCVEWSEIYVATAKAGIVVVPINFRLVSPEVRYIVEDSGAAALIVQDELAGVVEELRSVLPFRDLNVVHFGAKPCPAGWTAYEDLVAGARSSEPALAVSPADPWALMYTSGTTGKPKGAIRSHRSAAALALVTDVELGVGATDDALLVMPMCHANSLNFFGAFTYAGAVTSIYSQKNFDPELCLDTFDRLGTTFTSLVPTHYIMMLGLGTGNGSRDLSRISKLMISSAPAREDTKRAVMEMFRNSGLFELYGSTEAGWVTMLHPHDQFRKLGSVGRECIGSAPIRLLDEQGNEVPDGQPGELYSCTPYTFDGYWNMPEKTREAFRDGHCTVGDMALRDADGFIRLIDRKKNMIISGGENIYPSEVEGLLGGFPKIRDVAVIGLPDEKWGERVHAVVVLQDGVAATETEVLDWCRDRVAGYKRPRSITFLREDQMPRTATGKVLHRELRNLIAK
jgi:acyl-CoA synthetase (AMP-forming)/AMP-acid ligase II